MPRVKLFDKEEVLQKAMKLFWKQGYNATSIQDLVNHLGINRASLYDTFGGKQALFDKTFKLYRETGRKELVSFLGSHSSVKVGFYKLFERSIDGMISDPDAKGCFVVNTTTEMMPDSCNMSSIISDNKAAIKKIFHDYLKKGVESGEISAGKDLKSLASLLFTLYNGVMIVTKINPDRAELIATTRTALSLLD